MNAIKILSTVESTFESLDKEIASMENVSPAITRLIASLRAQIKSLKTTHRTDEERDALMLRIRNSFGEVPDIYGAKMATTMFTGDFFENDGDPKFTQMLATWLCEKFKTYSDANIDLWKEYK